MLQHAKKDMLVFHDGTFSFQEMNVVSDLLAWQLNQYTQNEICIVLEHTVRYYAFFLACMKARKTIFPVDAYLPAERLKVLLNDASDCLIVVENDLLYETLSEVSSDVITFHTFKKHLYGGERPWMQSDQEKDFYCHGVFTSGSTGRPQKVYHLQSNLAHDINTTYPAYEMDISFPVINMGYYTSSLHINGFWRAVMHGQTFVTGNLKIEKISNITDRIDHSDTKTIQSQPAILKNLLLGKEIKGVRHVILGGEMITRQLLEDWIRKLPSLQKITYNYSSTETMLIASITETPEWYLRQNRIPVGFTGPSKKIKIIDERGKEVPEGEQGQVVILSPYITDKITGLKSNKKLIKPDTSNLKLYYSGDVGYIDRDGILFHAGRIDRMLKINGNRIDPLQIEEALDNFPEITRSRVWSLKHNHQDVLVAALESGHNAPDIKGIRSALADRFPAFQVPSFFVVLQHFPQTSNGKVDLEKLYKMLEEDFLQQVSVRKNEMSRESHIAGQLHQIWSEILGKKQLDCTRSLFEQGADSLYTFMAMHEINAFFKTNHPIAFFWKNTTIAEQSENLI